MTPEIITSVMTFFLCVFAIGVGCGAILVSLLWNIWWQYEKRQPVHCSGCRCEELEEYEG